MRCKTVQKLLSDYVDGRFAGRKKARIEKHITQCDECYREFRLLVEMKDLLRSMPSEKPDEAYWTDMLPRLRERILRLGAEEEIKDDEAISEKKGKRPRLFWAGIGAAAFGMALLVLAALNTQVQIDNGELLVRIGFTPKASRAALTEEQKRAVHSEVVSLMKEYEAKRKAELALLVDALQAQRKRDLMMVNEKMEAMAYKTSMGFSRTNVALNSFARRFR